MDITDWNTRNRPPFDTGRQLAACLLVLVLSACSSEEPPAAAAAAGPAAVSGQAQPSVAGSSELAIEVALAPELEPDIRVASALAAVPGRSNPREVSLVLENRGRTRRKLLVSGQWQSDTGQGVGGASLVLEIAPGATGDFNAGTRSRAATHFVVRVEPTGTTNEQLQDAALVAAADGVQGHGIAYTPTPTLAAIPAWTPRGVANGVAFRAKSILFMPLASGWKMEIHDREVDPMKGVAITRSSYPDVQTININLPAEPRRGAVFEREMAYEGGFFQIKPSPGSTGTTSWNTSIAWAMEFTVWERRSWQDGGGTFQQAGTASGRIYICFQGSPQNIRSSWIAGEFIDAPIMYYGPPP